MNYSLYAQALKNADDASNVPFITNDVFNGFFMTKDMAKVFIMSLPDIPPGYGWRLDSACGRFYFEDGSWKGEQSDDT